jgi:hypothetical protein
LSKHFLPAIASLMAVIGDHGTLMFNLCEYEDGEMAWIEGSRKIAPGHDSVQNSAMEKGSSSKYK